MRRLILAFLLLGVTPAVAADLTLRRVMLSSAGVGEQRPYKLEKIGDRDLIELRQRFPLPLPAERLRLQPRRIPTRQRVRNNNPSIRVPPRCWKMPRRMPGKLPAANLPKTQRRASSPPIPFCPKPR